MSTTTRREKRKAKAQPPVDTDWLWCCPLGMRLDEIATQLGFTHEFHAELSTQRWVDDAARTMLQEGRHVGNLDGACMRLAEWRMREAFVAFQEAERRNETPRKLAQLESHYYRALGAFEAIAGEQDAQRLHMEADQE